MKSAIKQDILNLPGFASESVQCIGAKLNSTNYSDAIQLHRYPIISLTHYHYQYYWQLYMYSQCMYNWQVASQLATTVTITDSTTYPHTSHACFSVSINTCLSDSLQDRSKEPSVYISVHQLPMLDKHACIAKQSRVLLCNISIDDIRNYTR